VTFTVPVTLGRMVIVGNEVAAIPEYVKSFKMSYSLDSATWFDITDSLSFTEVR
jgi:hypothetical protein